jgi:hypothetical protein
LRYEGQGEVRLAPLLVLLRGLRIEAPQDWERAWQGTLVGPGKSVLLRHGDATSCIVYLHEFFSRSTPGQVEVRLAREVWRPEPGANPYEFRKFDREVWRKMRERATFLKSTVAVNLKPQGAAKLAERIKSVASQLSQEDRLESRIQLYRSIMSLSHRTLVPLLFQAVRDRQVDEYLGGASRSRLVDLCEAYHQRHAIVDYLVGEGGMGDGRFFSEWKSRGVVLSQEQLGQLTGYCSSFWVQLYCLEDLGDQGIPKSVYDAVEREAAEVQRRVRAARRRRFEAKWQRRIRSLFRREEL